VVVNNLPAWLRLSGLRAWARRAASGARGRLWARPRPLGIVGRLALSFLVVAVLAIAANLISQGKLEILRVSETRRERAAAPVAPPPAQMSVVETVGTPAPAAAPAPVPVPFPSAEPLLRALDRIDSAVDASAESDAAADLGIRYQKFSLELDHVAGVFASAAKAAGESPPARFMPSVRTYGQHGGELIKLGAARRGSMVDYSAHFERLNARVKKSLDHAWNIFGRVVARQSLVKLSSNLDELRRRYGELASADAVDAATFDALGSSEEALAKTLAEDRSGLTRADGKDWYSTSVDDLQAMAAARKALQQIDRQRKEGARRFADDFAQLSQIIDGMGKTETYDARQPFDARAPIDARRPTHGVRPVAQPATAAQAGIATHRWLRQTKVGGSGTLAAGQASNARTSGTANAQPSGAATVQIAGAPNDQTLGGAQARGAAGTQTPEGANAQTPGAGQTRASEDGTRIGVVSRVSSDASGDVHQTVSSTLLESPNEHGNIVLKWLTGGVLLLVVCISVFTALSIVRPVRRMVKAAGRIADGELDATVPRGGLRELDTLAVAFNNMAAQLAAAQTSARDQQQLLEATVAERTQQLQELAQLDPLTRLANRRHFFALLNTAIERATRENRLVGVFFLDIDNFKDINDGMGHEFGDHVLKAIAQRLSDSTHSFGFAARLGGDEFTVVYESASNIEDIRVAGLQLIKAFDDPLQLDGREVIVGVSAGASAYPHHAGDAEALLRTADTALYQAKGQGRGQLAVFTPALLETTAARSIIEQGLRRALDRGEFHLVFQPEVNLQTGATELVEALLRWRLPDGRYASPGEFLGVASASGLILQINDWVLRRALETVAHWHHGPWPGARVAINVSSQELFDQTFIERLQTLLAEYRLPPSCIEIELTEHVLQTGKSTIATLRELRELGIAIALDDFGAGFSSLASLEQLPLTRIKLDRSLMASVDTSPRSASIARAIIQLCCDLGLAITAEGIERLEQLSPLIGYPGLYAQGFLLAPPQSSDEVLVVMQTLPALTQALVRSSVARLPEAQLAEKLPFVTSAEVDR
jgi:diguanylate cyclase (GGDEF)-like protein